MLLPNSCPPKPSFAGVSRWDIKRETRMLYTHMRFILQAYVQAASAQRDYPISDNILSIPRHIIMKIYSFAFVAPGASVAAAAVSTIESRSFVFVTDRRQVIHDQRGVKGSEKKVALYVPKMTLSPSFHMDVTSVSPGYATPPKLRNRVIHIRSGPLLKRKQASKQGTRAKSF
jgi:hypothetical protein